MYTLAIVGRLTVGESIPKRNVHLNLADSSCSSRLSKTADSKTGHFAFAISSAVLWLGATTSLLHFMLH